MNKSALRLAFEAVPFHEFIDRSWRFICKPDITGESLENSSLRYAGSSFVSSFFLVVTFAVIFQGLFPQIFKLDIGQLVNPVYLSIALGFQAIVFSLILASISSVLLFPKKPTFHYLVAHQAVQVCAVMNLLVVIIFWICVNRMLYAGDIKTSSSMLDLLLGGGLAILAFYFSWRLLFRPLWNYMARYYEKRFALGMAVAVFSVTFWVNSYAVFGFGELIINESALCKQLYEIKRQRGEVDASVDEQYLIRRCTAGWKTGSLQ